MSFCKVEDTDSQMLEIVDLMDTTTTTSLPTCISDSTQQLSTVTTATLSQTLPVTSHTSQKQNTVVVDVSTSR